MIDQRLNLEIDHMNRENVNLQVNISNLMKEQKMYEEERAEITNIIKHLIFKINEEKQE